MFETIKSAEAVTIIGGADGPTSVFIAGRTQNSKTPIKQRIRQRIYQRRRKRAAKKICANPHTLQETAAYAVKKYHAVEIPKTKREYLEQYKSLKEGLIIRHRPELLGDMAEITHPEVLNEESAKELYRQMQLRSELAAKIPDHEMPMDFHIYEIRVENGRMEMGIDFTWNIFGLSHSGSKKAMKQLNRIARELYLYYGVSGDDIRNKTERYTSLLTALSSY